MSEARGPGVPGRRAIFGAALTAGAAVIAGAGAAPGVARAAPVSAAGAGFVPDGGAVCAALTPEEVRLQPTQHAPGGRGRMVLATPASPFGITVDADGRQEYVVGVHVERLRRRAGRHHVVWAATPELDRVKRLGVLGDDSRVEGPVAWNKFLVFVSEEAEPDGETWSGPILLTGLSPSGRMHTMAGHGPFEDVNCADYY